MFSTLTTYNSTYNSLHNLQPAPHAVQHIFPFNFEYDEQEQYDELSEHPFNQNIEYNSFNKASKISQNDFELEIFYGHDKQRRKSILKEGENTVYTRYYLGNYEKEIKGSTTTEYYYVGGPMGNIAVYISENGGDAVLYYTLTDHLGSIVAIADEEGEILEEQRYDPWGHYRNPVNGTPEETPQLTKLFRGYTGHEMLPEFGLINMNGRLYDPVIARVLSPDNYVQNPYNPQNYNRYSYCYNNPLVYVDPSGDDPLFIAAAIFIVFATEPGHELQKYVSPVTFRIDWGVGFHERKLGYEMSYGMPKLFPYAKRKHKGKSYYWKHISSDYKGWITWEGEETSYFGIYHKGETSYSAGKFSQTIGFRKYGIPSVFGVDLFNDYYGDKGDRYLTSVNRINFGPFSGVENIIFTGDPGYPLEGGTVTNHFGGDKYGTYIKDPNDPFAPDPDEYRAGVLSLRLGIMRIGWDSEGIRSFIQNTYHDRKGCPHFRDLRGTPEYEAMGGPRFYFQLGW